MRQSLLLAVAALSGCALASASIDLIEPLPCVVWQPEFEQTWQPDDAPTARSITKATDKPEQAPGSYG